MVVQAWVLMPARMHGVSENRGCIAGKAIAAELWAFWAMWFRVQHRHTALKLLMQADTTVCTTDHAYASSTRAGKDPYQRGAFRACLLMAYDGQGTDCDYEDCLGRLSVGQIATFMSLVSALLFCIVSAYLPSSKIAPAGQGAVATSACSRHELLSADHSPAKGFLLCNMQGCGSAWLHSATFLYRVIL